MLATECFDYLKQVEIRQIRVEAWNKQQASAGEVNNKIPPDYIRK